MSDGPTILRHATMDLRDIEFLCLSEDDQRVALQLGHPFKASSRHLGADGYGETPGKAVDAMIDAWKNRIGWPG